jgi:Protein-tyrosine phosphatase
VVEIRRVVVCAQCRLPWDEGSEPAKCRNDDHEHRVFETHRHLGPVVLPDGTRVTAASFDPAAPYSRARDPDYGLYLDPRWQPPWDHGYVDWPDFGVPADAEAVAGALKTVLERARSGQDVEVGCLGGHGRTGTALACLAVLAGYPASDAVAWVRSSYCAKAVETPEQEAFVAALFGSR